MNSSSIFTQKKPLRISTRVHPRKYQDRDLHKVPSENFSKRLMWRMSPCPCIRKLGTTCGDVLEYRDFETLIHPNWLNGKDYGHVFIIPSYVAVQWNVRGMAVQEGDPFKVQVGIYANQH
ncbi:uncharacterized protein [Diadema setosum]|uniref:uncharacterized protein n=1 Tax=Diadema setosum TaxID=31175 RepID=UPI003B3B45E3